MKYQEDAPGLNLTQYETPSKPRQDRQCTHKPNNEVLSWNHFSFCRGEVLSITYSECVSVALVIQYAKGMRRNVNVICGLSDCTAFLYIILQTLGYSEKILNIKYKKVNSPITGLEVPRGFQEVNVPRFNDNGTRWW